jgi:hypothetical protein
VQESRAQIFSCTEFWSEKDSRRLQEWKAFPYATLIEQTEAARAGSGECILRRTFHFGTRFDEEAKQKSVVARSVSAEYILDW